MIGGCGTGKEPIESAELIADIKITAIDLSFRSLGYAIRKSNELNLKNINFLQGNILDLCNLNEKFDIVQSSGVIHHMKDPFEGCEALLKCLKPSGLLKLSVYSKIARRNIINLQNQAKLKDIHTHEVLRNFRKELIDNDINENFIMKWSDFYNSSEFKDLICHEQEHTFTIKKIKELIKFFNLKFCGFQNSNFLHEKFIKHHNSSKNLYNLDHWEEFETIFPDTFSCMYQFWCQKI